MSATTIGERLMQDVMKRLAAVPGFTRRRRDHLTPVARADCPAYDLEMGDDRTVQVTRTCQEMHELAFAVCIFVRTDETSAAADPLVRDVYAALDPSKGTAYSGNAVLSLMAIRRPRPEIADADALEVRVEGNFAYICGAFKLDASGEE